MYYINDALLRMMAQREALEKEEDRRFREMLETIEKQIEQAQAVKRKARAVATAAETLAQLK